MSNFDEFCYLVIQRQKANLKRRRLLYALNKVYKENNMLHKYHIRDHLAKDERKAYRDQAEAMKKIAKNAYSPMRKELKIKCRYDASNSISWLRYQSEYYSYSQIEKHANSYLFETILLSENKVNDAYKDLV